MIKELNSYEETKELGKFLGKNAKKGEVYCLVGDLGTGKTVMSKGMCDGLGIEDEITSPTFTIVNTYEARLDVFHFDVYRINDISEMDDLGYEDMFYGDGVCIVEWADMIKDLIPSDAIWIKLTRNLEIGEDYRKIEIEGLKYEL